MFNDYWSWSVVPDEWVSHAHASFVVNYPACLAYFTSELWKRNWITLYSDDDFSVIIIIIITETLKSRKITCRKTELGSIQADIWCSYIYDFFSLLILIFFSRSLIFRDYIWLYRLWKMRLHSVISDHLWLISVFWSKQSIMPL